MDSSFGLHACRGGCGESLQSSLSHRSLPCCCSLCDCSTFRVCSRSSATSSCSTLVHQRGDGRSLSSSWHSSRRLKKLPGKRLWQATPVQQVRSLTQGPIQSAVWWLAWRQPVGQPVISSEQHTLLMQTMSADAVAAVDLSGSGTTAVV